MNVIGLYFSNAVDDSDALRMTWIKCIWASVGSMCASSKNKENWPVFCRL